METATLLGDENHLLTAVATLFHQAAIQQRESSAPFLQVSSHLQRIKPSRQPLLPPGSLPVCQYLERTLKAPSVDATLVTALRPLLSALAWIQNPNYLTGNMPAGFLENYGYADIVSPRGLIADDKFALGILLLGPNTEYLPHYHPAEEIYYTVGGVCDWWQTGQLWTQQQPGAFVYHPSGVVHAMRTAKEPVCLLYTWWGAVQSAAQLSQAITFNNA